MDILEVVVTPAVVATLEATEVVIPGVADTPTAAAVAAVADTPTEVVAATLEVAEVVTLEVTEVATLEEVVDIPVAVTADTPEVETADIPGAMVETVATQVETVATPAAEVARATLATEATNINRKRSFTPRDDLRPCFTSHQSSTIESGDLKHVSTLHSTSQAYEKQVIENAKLCSD